MTRKRHVVFIQHGDYGEAFRNFERGGAETYAAQRHSVELVAGLTKEFEVTVIALPAAVGEEILENGVRVIGMGFRGGARSLPLIRTLERLRPTDLVLRAPLPAPLAWGLLRARNVLPIYADSFQSGKLSRRARQALLVALLNQKKIQLVSNHNVPAAKDLVRIGVKAEKVVPWDWPSARKPDDHPAKDPPSGGQPFSLFFAGAVTRDKGVPDILQAIALLRSKGTDVRASIAGSSPQLEELKAEANQLGVDEHVQFLGRIPNSDVSRLMREHSAVVVPSRLSYPEGLPLVIYEGLCSRSPVLLSRHPMFVEAFGASPGVCMFEPSSPESLAQKVEELRTDPQAYRALSQESPLAWKKIQVPLTWGEVVTAWLDGSDESIARLKAHALAASSAPLPTVPAS